MMLFDEAVGGWESPRSLDRGDADASMSSSIGCPAAGDGRSSGRNSSVDGDANRRMDSVWGVLGGVRSNTAEAEEFPPHPGSDSSSVPMSSSSNGIGNAPWSTLDGIGFDDENFGVPEFDRAYGSESVHNDVDHDAYYFGPTPHSTEDFVEALLLSLLEKMGCPRYAFDTIMDWARYASDNKYDFAAGGRRKRASFVSKLRDRYRLGSMRPRVMNLPLTRCTTHDSVQMVYFDFASSLKNLLLDEVLMDPKNLVINPDDPYSMYESPGGVLDEINSGEFYRMAYKAMITNPEKEILLPVLIYADKTGTDGLCQRFGLEPVRFTTSLLKRRIRNQASAWRCIGYIFDMYHRSTAEGARKKVSTCCLPFLFCFSSIVPLLTPLTMCLLQKGDGVRHYHEQLAFLLEGLIAVQVEGMMFPFRLNEGEKARWMSVKVPVAFIIGDTKGSDIFAGKYGSHNSGRISRACDCDFEEADNPYVECVANIASVIEETIHRGDADSLRNMSQHAINNAFSPVHFGGQISGVHGCSPMDLMHALQHGLMKHIISCIMDRFTPGFLSKIDGMVKEVAVLLRQSVRIDFPRSDFTNGITNCTLKTCSEQSGSVFVLSLVLSTKKGMDIFRRQYGTESQCNACRDLLHKLLWYEAWTKRDSFWRRGDTVTRDKADTAVRSLLYDISVKCPRSQVEKTNGWKIPKFHEHTHLVSSIERYGSPKNFNAGPCENHHIATCKRPARTAQKRHKVFTLQAAERLAENGVIEHSVRKMAHSHNLPQRLSNMISSVGQISEERLQNEQESENYFQYGGSCNHSSTFFLGNFAPDGSTRLYLRSRDDSASSPPRVMFGAPSSLLDYLKHEYYENGDLDQPRHKELQFVSEYVRAEKTRYRAHWDYRKEGAWMDWALVNWGPNDGHVPGKVLMFAKYVSEESDDDDSASYMSGLEDTGGVTYEAIIISGASLPSINNRLTRKFKLHMRPRPRNLPAGVAPPPDTPVYAIVDAQCLSTRILVLPNIGGEEHSMLQVIPIQDWSNRFLSMPVSGPVPEDPS
jgi:hypothetical protein